MTSEGLKKFHERLLTMRAAIQSLDESRRDSSEVVELDQSRMGRLSRMDALQLQSMAKAGQARSQQELQQIDAALARLAQGDFGNCFECGETIAAARLEASPAVTLCISCATERES